MLTLRGSLQHSASSCKEGAKRQEGILSPSLPFANQPIFFWLQRLAIFRVYGPWGPVRTGEDVTGKVWARISANQPD